MNVSTLVGNQRAALPLHRSFLVAKPMVGVVPVCLPKHTQRRPQLGSIATAGDPRLHTRPFGGFLPREGSAMVYLGMPVSQHARGAPQQLYSPQQQRQRDTLLHKLNALPPHCLAALNTPPPTLLHHRVPV